MLKDLKVVGDASVFRSLTAFKPRQVLLQSAKHRSDTKHGSSCKMLKDQKALFLKSICLYLEKNGFSKTLKKFRSEAEIEKDSWKSCSLNLEEICCKHLQTCSQGKAGTEAVKGQHTFFDGLEDAKVQKVIGDQPINGTLSKPSSEDALTMKSEKKKKKDKSANKSLNGMSESQQKAAGVLKNVTTDGATMTNKGAKDSETGDNAKSEEKPKSKSKKKMQEPEITRTEQVFGVENPFGKERKSSKKRKITQDDEHSDNDVRLENSKRRKTNNFDETGAKVENGDRQTPSSKKLENGNLEENSRKKTVFVEPKSLNAFQRVKADEVEFADERLQDNSFWAKDGAEVGYGAKAQEVLGQVRGRDFRHEKTKKKRGSYRGGQIDLESRSVKFAYNDEDE